VKTGTGIRNRGILDTVSSLKKPGKNILLQKETWMVIGAVAIALVIVSFVFAFLWNKFILMFYWVIGALAIFLTRRKDFWYMGIEIHFPLAFYMTYAFGWMFAFSMVIIAYLCVWKVRPDQGHGIMIQMTSLNVMMLLSLVMKHFYGTSLGAGKFLFIFLICFISVQLLDGILSKMFCPSPPLKILIIHSLDVIINFYVAKFIGYKFLMYLFTL
jgi:hypothetical protein